MAPDPYRVALANFMAVNKPPWHDHPETCPHHPRPNLVDSYRRAGFLHLRRIAGANCTGCGWRVEGHRLVAMRDWEAYKAAQREAATPTSTAKRG